MQRKDAVHCIGGLWRRVLQCIDLRYGNVYTTRATQTVTWNCAGQAKLGRFLADRQQGREEKKVCGLMHACERPRAGMTMKDDDHVLEWKHRLPTSEELTPLSKALISPVLQSVFSIKPEAPKTAADVSRESRGSFLDLRSQRSGLSSFDPFPLFKERKGTGEGASL